MRAEKGGLKKELPIFVSTVTSLDKLSREKSTFIRYQPIDSRFVQFFDIYVTVSSKPLDEALIYQGNFIQQQKTNGVNHDWRVFLIPEGIPSGP